MTFDEAVKTRHEAQIRLHWHLTRAAQYALQDLVLGHEFEKEMLQADRARLDWYAGHDAILRSEPPRAA